ncbi:MAG: thioredoxin domain-containing protein [Verrucomicrobiota bacterium]
MSDSPAAPSPANRLAREKSPYLLQHARNPVDWYPWGEEAFERARKEDKPIFLSIGYSTCHWCHVMERESFEDPATGAYLREHFISIKVDREERPDVDKIYLTFVQVTTGGGGWPLNVFLTPDLKPFYGGTYFPPAPKHGRPSLRQLLEKVVELWKARRKDIAESADELTARLRSVATHDAGNAYPAGARELLGAGQTFLAEFDPEHGGFGGPPKFPRPSVPLFLLRYARRFGEAPAREAVLLTCRKMAAGGMYDQLGGGFARFSVDDRWRVPHFEKMLYDNAQLVQLFLDAHLQDGGGGPAAVVREVLRYVFRDLTHPEGGFYSAEDADSEGHEGKFYCWTLAEVKSLLTPEEAAVAIRHFGITAKGNFVDHSHPQPLEGQNVLSVVDPKLTPEESGRLASAQAKLLAARARRVRPHRDDKILASWNGMMLGAVARAAAVLGDDAYRVAAERNLAFLKAKLWVPPAGDRPGTLSHRWRDGGRDTVQLLDAYAHLLAGVVDLYEATVDPRHLEFAVQLAGAMMARFYDPPDGGFWQAGAETPHLLVRVKEDYDGAEPSGNSVAALALLRLAAITGRRDWREAAEKTVRLFAQKLHQTPQAVPHLLLALDFLQQEPKRVVLVGDFSCGSTASLLRAAHAVYEPNKVILGNRGPVDPFARTLPVNEEFTQAFCCTGTACQPPTRDRARLREFLGKRAE